MKTKLVFQTVVGAAGYIAWAIMAYLDPTQRPDFLHFNVAMAVGTIGLVLRDMRAGADPVPAPPIDKQGGFASIAFLIALVVVALLLSGCGTLNAYTGAALNAAESGYTGARQNAKSGDDMKFILWADSACAIPLGSLARNATGNPYAVNAALTACPVPNVGIVQAKDGQVQVQLTQPTPTAPYVAPTPSTNARATP